MLGTGLPRRAPWPWPPEMRESHLAAAAALSADGSLGSGDAGASVGRQVSAGQWDFGNTGFAARRCRHHHFEPHTNLFCDSCVGAGKSLLGRERLRSHTEISNYTPGSDVRRFSG
jgi:hypothetical protein